MAWRTDSLPVPRRRTSSCWSTRWTHWACWFKPARGSVHRVTFIAPEPAPHASIAVNAPARWPRMTTMWPRSAPRSKSISSRAGPRGPRSPTRAAGDRDRLAQEQAVPGLRYVEQERRGLHVIVGELLLGQWRIEVGILRPHPVLVHREQRERASRRPMAARVCAALGEDRLRLGDEAVVSASGASSSGGRPPTPSGSPWHAAHREP